MAERARHPWRSEGGKPWKMISVWTVQKRCALKLAAHLLPEHIEELDRLTGDHCARVAGLSKEEWDARAPELETLVAEEAMTLAARIAGMRPCPGPAPRGGGSADGGEGGVGGGVGGGAGGGAGGGEWEGAVAIGMRGSPDLPCNFSHWWIEVPTGREEVREEMGEGGEEGGKFMIPDNAYDTTERQERVRCETYPSASVYFTPCYQDYTPRGSFRIFVTGALPQHLAGMAAALADVPIPRGME